jgi:hypothetical protein
MANLFSYLSRSKEQILQDLKVMLPSELPEIKDYESDILVRGLKIWANLAENLHYYIDNVARETHISTCRLFSSAVELAVAEDYRVRGFIPCNVNLTFTLSAVSATVVLIPKGTICETADGIQYITTQDLSIPIGQLSGITNASQETFVPSAVIGITNGTENQKLILAGQIVDNSLDITIASEQYEAKETFFRSLPASLHFIQSVNSDAITEIKFGDGINGKLPSANQNINASYYTTLGTKGRVGKNKINKIVSTLSLPSGITATVTNVSESFAGSDREKTVEIAKNVSILNRTVETAISRDTYRDLGELAPGVAKAGLSYNYGTTVDIFVIPDGGGIANQAFLDAVEAYYQDKIIICTRVNVGSAGEVDVVLDIDVELLSNADRLETSQKIKNALVSFGSLDTQDISGRMVSGNIAQIVCNVAGVKSCIINVFSIIPYARPISSTTELNWDATLLVGSIVPHNWKIRFTASNTFQLFKDDTFAGNYTVGFLVSLPEISFIINQNYATNDEWTFVIYPFLGDRSGSYELSEPAILSIKESNITLNLIGGI